MLASKNVSPAKDLLTTVFERFRTSLMTFKLSQETFKVANF